MAGQLLPSEVNDEGVCVLKMKAVSPAFIVTTTVILGNLSICPAWGSLMSSSPKDASAFERAQLIVEKLEGTLPGFAVELRAGMEKEWVFTEKKILECRFPVPIFSYKGSVAGCIESDRIIVQKNWFKGNNAIKQLSFILNASVESARLSESTAFQSQLGSNQESQTPFVTDLLLDPLTDPDVKTEKLQRELHRYGFKLYTNVNDYKGTRIVMTRFVTGIYKRHCEPLLQKDGSYRDQSVRERLDFSFDWIDREMEISKIESASSEAASYYYWRSLNEADRHMINIPIRQTCEFLKNHVSL